MRQGLTNCGIVLAFAVTLAACGGDDNSGPGPSGPSDPGSPGTTVTITSSGVSPRTLTVSPGSRVTFVNNDNRAHEPASDPHPSHGSCPPIDQVGTVAVGQSRTSGNFNTLGTCRYHDHLNDTNTNFNGTIVVQ